MNWLDYLRGYEEGSFARRSSGEGGLLGSLIQLAISLVVLIAMLCFFAGITLLKIAWQIITGFFGLFRK